MALRRIRRRPQQVSMPSNRNLYAEIVRAVRESSASIGQHAAAAASFHHRGLARTLLRDKMRDQ
jgi:hypothetical protein